jgi:hypothetical protein
VHRVVAERFLSLARQISKQSAVNKMNPSNLGVYNYVVCFEKYQLNFPLLLKCLAIVLAPNVLRVPPDGATDPQKMVKEMQVNNNNCGYRCCCEN